MPNEQVTEPIPTDTDLEALIDEPRALPLSKRLNVKQITRFGVSTALVISPTMLGILLDDQLTDRLFSDYPTIKILALILLIGGALSSAPKLIESTSDTLNNINNKKSKTDLLRLATMGSASVLGCTSTIEIAMSSFEKLMNPILAIFLTS